MRDLKHLIYFEDLLQTANNELIQKAKKKGGIAVAYTCENVPEPLLNLGKCFSIRLSAPQTGSMDIATFYMTNLLCEPSRALLERAIEGGFNFADCVITPDGCTMMNRCVENMELLETMGKDNPNFFHQYMEIAFKNTDNDVNLSVLQCTNHVLNPLHEHYGVDISDKAIRKAVEAHNRLCRVITEIGNFRKLPNPPITGYEFHVIQLVSEVCPHELILPYLEETLEELKTREPEPKFPFRARVVVVGSEIDDPEFTKLIESCGAMVVADRYCFGSFPGREEIEIFGNETAFDAVCRHYLHWNQCARFMDGMKIEQRTHEVQRLVKEFSADGVIYENMKFCEFWSYEKVLQSHIFINELNVPTCTIEKEYMLGAVGQLRTRFQAFIESLEIKQIQGGK